MPRKLRAGIDERLLRQIANYPDGVGIEELIGLLGGEISRRSLQRHLAKFVDSGSVILKGAGPTTRYVPSKASDVEQDYVPLSPSGADVRQLVRRSLAEANAGWL